MPLFPPRSRAGQIDEAQRDSRLVGVAVANDDKQLFVSDELADHQIVDRVVLRESRDLSGTPLHIFRRRQQAQFPLPRTRRPRELGLARLAPEPGPVEQAASAGVRRLA